MCARKIEPDAFFEENVTVSSTECTGIAPSGITDDTEAEEVSHLYSIHKPESSGRDGEYS